MAKKLLGGSAASQTSVIGQRLRVPSPKRHQQSQWTTSVIKKQSFDFMLVK